MLVGARRTGLPARPKRADGPGDPSYDLYHLKSHGTMTEEAPKKLASPFWMWVLVSGICLAGLLIPFVVFVEAPPPRRIVIATGRQDGAYHRFAQQYVELLRK